MPKNPLITSEIANSYFSGFKTGFDEEVTALFGFEVKQSLTNKIESVVDTRFLYHIMMGNHLLGDWSNLNEEEVISEIKVIGKNYGYMFGEQVIAFVNSRSVLPIAKGDNVETKSVSGTNNKESEFGGENKSQQSGENSIYNVDEIAPINSLIDDINTPNQKNKQTGNSSLGVETEYTNSGTENRTYSEIETLNKSLFENLLKMTEFYLEKGNLFSTMIELMIDKSVYECNVIW